MICTYQAFQPTLTEQGLERFGLSLQHSNPCKMLRHVVHSYLQITTDRPTPYPVIPDATQAVFISPHGLQISGAQSQVCDVQILQPGDYFGIRFYPGALRFLVNLNVSEITNQFVDCSDLPWQNSTELHAQIYRHKHFHQRAQCCEHWLLRHFNNHSATPFDHALSLIYRSVGNIKVTQLASKVGWSCRHLNRMFRLHTGLDTKSFAQIIRLQHVCKRLYSAPADALNVALEVGFCDQSHLIKDFRQHLLASPSLFFERFMSDYYNR